MLFPEKVFLNGKIHTMKDPGHAVPALAVHSGRIVAAGSDEEIQSIKGPQTETVDLMGHNVIPGLIDTHVHLLSYCQRAALVSLRGVKSLAEVAHRLKQRIGDTPPGEWVRGDSFDHTLFQEKRMPTRWDLDRISADHPILLSRYCMHAFSVNSLGLKLAGIRKDSRAPSSGTIEKDPQTGEPTGILWENAINPVLAILSDPLSDFASRKEAVKRELYRASTLGLTGMHPIEAKICDALEDIRVYQELMEEESLPVRIYVSYDEMPSFGMKTGFGNSMLRLGFYKIFVDGSLGSRSAALSAPYSDQADNKGILIYSEEELKDKVLAAHHSGMQVGMHCIGDEAVRFALNAVENALTHYPAKDPRFRLIHCCVLNEDLMSRMQKLPVLVDSQPTYVSTNNSWVEQRVGKRARLTYAWKSLLNRGIPLAGSSDCPVESLNPFEGIYAAVTRQDLEGNPPGGWIPEEKLSVFEALSLYTKNAAYASFEENIKGSLEPGKLADFIVLSSNPFTVKARDLKDIRVLQTYLAGKPVEEKKS